MKAIELAEAPVNVVELAIQPKPKPQKRDSRFKITEFHNRAGTISYRVAGYKLDGTRIRENFADENAARCRQIDLEAECLKQPMATSIRATKLTDDQLRLVELAILKLGDDWPRIVDAVDHWTRSGAKNISIDAPRIDDAIGQYLAWLETSTLRDHSKRHFKIRVNVFKNSVQNVRVSEVTPEFIEAFLATRKTSAVTRDTDRRVVSRFFSWCIERPRRWMIANPCREVKIEQGEKAPPAVLALAQCEAILRAAEQHRGGILVPYVAVCLFGGLRPFEARRLTWGQVNLTDGEIRLAGTQTKTGTGRTVKICPTLKAWLKANKGKSFFPVNWRKEFEAVKSAAKITEWPVDVLRHTAISHYFRKTGSYGFTAEQFGNSEAIIKEHYQSRVSSEDTKAFYKLTPTKGGVE
jgi:integrase